ncbi:MAG: phospholipid carrier-dependent glycosyltransferase [Candidatus Sericytochromatia bacterium]
MIEDTNKVENTKISFWEKLKDPDNKSILIILGIALLVRLLFSLAFSTGHPTDINNFRVWTLEVAKRGLYDFFQPSPKGVWCDYPPGYIYILWILGNLYSFFDPVFQYWYASPFTTVVKLPGIVCDVFNVFLIYELTRRYVPKFVARSSAIIYAFQPAMFFEAAIWGQMDSVIMTCLLLSIIYLIDRKYIASIFITCVGCLMKPQGILLIPFIGFILIYKKAFKEIALGVLASFALVFALTLPITRDIMKVLPWLWEHYVAQANLYPYSSIQTFNLWGLTGLWQSDLRKILGITHKNIGLFLYLAFYAFSCYYYYKKTKENPVIINESKDNDSEIKLNEYKTDKRLSLNTIEKQIQEIRASENEEAKENPQLEIESLEKERLVIVKEIEEANLKFENIKKEQKTPSGYSGESIAIIHGATLALLGFFMFPTRMHERYLFVGLSFLGISAALNSKLKNVYLWLSATFLINLFYEFPGDKTNLGAPSFMTGLTNFLKTGKMYTENFGLYWFTPIVIINIFIFLIILYRLWRDPMVQVSKDDILSYQENKLKEENKEESLSSITKGKGFSFPVIQKFDLKDLSIILIMMVVSTLLRMFYLTFPEEMVFDEVYHARAAGEYMRGVNPFEWVHPPLAKLLISVGTSVFGLNSFGWRIMPVIFGTLFIPIMYIFGKSMFGKRYTGILAALIVSIDGVFFVQSRTAMTNIFATFFQITAVMFFWLYVQHDYHQEKKSKTFTYFALSGLFISLALATRWTSLGALAFILGAMIWYKFLFTVNLNDLLSGDFKALAYGFNKKEIPFWILAGICFVILPASIYLMAYIPYMNLNHTIKETLDMQKGIYSYHKNLRDPHPYYSEWYTWPFLIRPTWYYFRDFKDGTMGGIIALGNPAIWWSSVFVTIFSLYKAIKEKQAHLLYIGLGFIILYLPWAVSPRIKNFSHYLFEAIPYACLSITFLISYLWEKGNKKIELTKEDKTFNILAISAIALLIASLLFIGFLSLWVIQWKNPFPIAVLEPYSQRMFNSASYLFISLLAIILYFLYENARYRTLSIVYTLLIIGMFIFFYPLYSGYPIPFWYYGLHIWMTSWI